SGAIAASQNIRHSRKSGLACLRRLLDRALPRPKTHCHRPNRRTCSPNIQTYSRHTPFPAGNLSVAEESIYRSLYDFRVISSYKGFWPPMVVPATVRLRLGAVGLDRPDASQKGEILRAVPAGIVELQHDPLLASGAGRVGEG